MVIPGVTIRLKSIYSRPWSKIAKNITFPQPVLKKIGRLLVKEIVLEAKRQYRAQGNRSTPIGEPEGLPKGPEFYRSFSYKIRGKSTVEVWSDWPVIKQLMEGREPYKMVWLTHEEGRPLVSMKQRKGVALVRTTPIKRKDAWIHPGFAEHDFIKKGIANAQQKVAKILTDELAKKLAKGDPTR